MSKDTNETIKEKIFDLLVKYVPAPIIFITCIYVFIIYWINKIFFKLIDTTSITDKNKNKYIGIVIIIMLIITIIYIVGIVLSIILIKKRRKRLKKTQGEDINESDSKIEAHIIEASDYKARNDIYLNVNQRVQKSYKVYGTSLHSIASNHEEMLLKMADNKVDIQLCMMNPAITEDELCKNFIESGSCAMYNLLTKEEHSNKDLEKRLLEIVQNHKYNSNESKIYISPCYIKNYFNTATDYRKRLKSSYDDLKAIIKNIKSKGKNNAEVKIMNSFIPISITIADAEEDSGKMVVEFYIPYTSNRVLIELNKKQHEKLFEGFLRFYDSLWNQAY